MTEPIDHVDLSDVIDAGIDLFSSRLWIKLIGRVVKIDIGTQRASVQPVRRDPLTGAVMPVIPNLSLRSEKSNGGVHGALWIPIGIGEIVTVSFLTHPIDEWLACESVSDDDVSERKGGAWRSDYSSAYYERGISQFCDPLPPSATHATSPVLSGNPVLLGDSTATSNASKADEVNERFEELRSWIVDTLIPAVAAGLLSGPPAEWILGVPNVDADKVKVK